MDDDIERAVDSVTEYPLACPRCGSHWNMSKAGWRTNYGCFSCLFQWWNLRKRSA